MTCLTVIVHHMTYECRNVEIFIVKAKQRIYLVGVAGIISSTRKNGFR